MFRYSFLRTKNEIGCLVPAISRRESARVGSDEEVDGCAAEVVARVRETRIQEERVWDSARESMD